MEVGEIKQPVSAPLELKATFHKSAFQVMPSPQQAYFLLEAKPSPSVPGSGTQPVNFCMVLDRSGSMAGEKLAHLKQAAKNIVNQLGAQDLLSIVVFDDIEPAQVVFSASPVIDREKIHQQIEMIEERGGTRMSTGMRLGLSELNRVKSPERINSMLLLTDGQTWEDEDECLSLAENCRQAGIPIYIMGLGLGEENNWNPQFLEDLAQRSGGDWVTVEKADQIEEMFETTLRAVKGTAITNARLTLRMVSGVTPRVVWRTTPMIIRLDHHAVSAHDVQVFLGDIQHGIGQALLADLLLPQRGEGTYRLIQADMTFDIPGMALEDQKVSLDILVPYVESASQANQTNARVMNIVERVVAHKLQTQALDEAAAGDIARATQRLRAAATRLLELGEDELAAQASQQAANLEEHGAVDKAAAQKMRYATKKLTEIDFE